MRTKMHLRCGTATEWQAVARSAFAGVCQLDAGRVGRRAAGCPARDLSATSHAGGVRVGRSASPSAGAAWGSTRRRVVTPRASWYCSSPLRSSG